MSEFYKQSNNESSLRLFNKRIIYADKISQTGEGSLVDFTLAEKVFYGKTDRRFLPIALNQKFIKLKRFRSSANPEQNIQALSFVVDAFESLSQQFKKAQQVGKIDSNDPNLTNLKVYKSYVNHSISYNEYQNQLLLSLKNNLNINNINNFESFVEELLSTITIVTNSYPLSMPAYIKSRLNSITNTGIALEIADAPYDNDEQKISQFVDSKNWSFYVNACNSYGFMIDINAPWRLVADLDSIAMTGYAKRYDLQNVNEILGLGFSNIHNSYFQQLPAQLLNLYNNLVPTHQIVSTDCGPEVIRTDRYTLDSLNKKYNNDFFLDFYLNLRFSEEQNSYSEAERQRIMKDCRELAVATTTRNALNVFERYVNQPFDYRGSLSYLNKARRLREDT